MPIDTDNEGRPFGWEMVSLTPRELDALVDAAEACDLDEAERIVEGAYERLFEVRV